MGALDILRFAEKAHNEHDTKREFLYNSFYLTKAEFNNCFLFIQNVSKFLTQSLPCRLSSNHLLFLSLHSKRFRASSSRKLGREQKKKE